MTDDLIAAIRNRFQDAQHNVNSGRTLLRRKNAEVDDDLLCHINHVIRNMEDARGLLTAEARKEVPDHQQSMTLGFDESTIPTNETQE